MQARGRSCVLRGASLALAACALSAQAEPITFYKHIAPIVNQYCAPCHRPGEPGPFPLLTYADVRKRGAQIVAVTRRRYMPPWLPQPGHGEFQEERRLTDEQIHTIAEWVREGAPAGSPQDAPPPPHFVPGWQLGQPDLVLEASTPFRLPAGGPDEYWNFVLPLKVAATRWVKAIEIRPGAARAVHHANVLIDHSHSARMQEKTPGAGFPGMDLNIESDTFDPDSHFLFWKPGGTPWVEPDGMAWRADPGTDLVLNVHMQPTGKPELVQPSIGLYFTDQPGTKFPMLLQLEHDGALDIPAGRPRTSPVSDDFVVPMDMDVLAVYPHAHYLGHVLEGYATLPGGNRQWLDPHSGLGPELAGRLSLQGTGVPAQRRDRVDALSLRQLGRQSAQSPSASPTRARREPGHRRNGPPLAAGSPARRRGPPHGVAGSHHAPPAREVSWRVHVAVQFGSAHAGPRGRRGRRHVLAWRRGGAAGSARRVEHAGRGPAFHGRRRRCHRHSLSAHSQSNPRYTNARYNLANALAELRQWDRSAAEFRKVLAVSPDDAGARQHLGEVLRLWGDEKEKAGRLEEAAARLRESLDLRPDDALLHSDFGALLARLGRFREAVPEFETALRLDPHLETARRNLEAARARLER